MERLAILCGLFLGAVLKECAPVLAEILAEGIRRANTSTVEDGKAPADLGAALRARIAAVLHRDADGNRAAGGSNPDQGAGKGQGLGV
jgi:hypothetical protein